MNVLARVIAEWSIQCEMAEDLIHEGILYGLLNRDDNEELI